MKPIIEKLKASNHFDVYYLIEHPDLFSSDGIVSAINDLREAWQHFLNLRKQHQKERLPYYFCYYFHDGKNLFKPERTPAGLYDNLTIFWKNAASEKNHISVYKLYLDDIRAHWKDDSINKFDRSPWHSETIQVGEVASFQLAMADQSYISIYSDLLQYWDMGHEVNQYKEVQSVTEKYGITDETLNLMRQRCSSRGQHGHAQFLNFLKLAKSSLGDLRSKPKLVKLIRDFGTLGWDSDDLKYEDPNWDWTRLGYVNDTTLGDEIRAEILDILNYKSSLTKTTKLVKARLKGILNP